MDTDQAALLNDLSRIARDPARRIFALVDGAPFEDLPELLVAAGVSHRSLYRNVQDTELVRAGPWLVDPYCHPDPTLNTWGGLPSGSSGEDAIAADTRAALREPQPDASSAFDRLLEAADPQVPLEAVIRLIGDSPAAIFWIGDAGLTEAALWQHLRTLNMVLIPREYDNQKAPRPVEGEETHDAVMFRHGDGNVLAEVLPVLDAAQFSRVFGPARALMFLAPDHPASDGSAIRRAVLPGDTPPAPPGMLTLSKEQMAGIEEARLDRSRRKVMSYLREVDEQATSEMSDAELSNLIVQYERSGNAIGLSSERAHMKWAYLMSVSGGDIAKGQETREFFVASSKHPDDRIDDLVDMLDKAWLRFEGSR